MVPIRYYLGIGLLGLYLALGLDPVRAKSPIDVMRSQVGVREASGKNDGVQVAQYLASVGLGQGYAWCAAIVHWSYRQCGSVQKPTRSFAMASAWHPKQCRVWESPDEWTPNPVARISAPGDHFALYYTNLGRIGHTGLIESEDDDYVVTIEGNTNGGGSRDGDGVYRRKRLKRTLHCVSRW